MVYVWDVKKALSNFRKHGIHFEEAQVVWTDPHALEFIDDESSENEERYLRIGLNPARGVLLVVFCEREYGETIRLISARKATVLEKKIYEEELRS